MNKFFKVTSKTFAKLLASKNKPKYNLTKAAEELNELSTVLLQRVNKGGKVDSSKITEEIGHCLLRIEVLYEIFDEKEIIESYLKKRSKLLKNFENGKYKGTL